MPLAAPVCAGHKPSQGRAPARVEQRAQREAARLVHASGRGGGGAEGDLWGYEGIRTDHRGFLVDDRAFLVDYRWMYSGSKCIFMG